MSNRLICCDWGTSNMRLHLVDRLTCEEVAYVKSCQGVAKVDSSFNGQSTLSRQEYFAEFLASQIEELEKEVGSKLSSIPVTLSGMASSSIGMVEVEYAQVPVSLSTPRLNCIKINRSRHCDHDLYIFGGLMTSDDVMRGEEVQILGVIDSFCTKDCLCILPGTHSKHVRISNGVIDQFDTFMTGEMFGLLSNYGLLKNSVLASDTISEEKKEAFKKGVEKGVSANLLNELFKIRTRDLIENISHELNYYYLSGVIIGSELKALRDTDYEVIICGGHKLSSLYKIAFDILYDHKVVKVIPKNEMIASIPKAHVQLFHQQLESEFS